MNERVQAVEQILQDIGHSHEIVTLPDDAHTALAAAEAIGCEVAQIAKSIIFRLELSETALLVVASGINRIDESKVETIVGEKLAKADANFVRKQTGFVIGGVAPIGHSNPIQILIDEDLLQYETIWAAAGHPKTVFQMTPEELVEMTGGKVVQVKK
ncbi:YbaK/EbsC family protein [Shimazuella sp. AN120528]|uniref:YbaK/EbsC family protein n=1 Tax=Shimazuella soli TaxID=1892854 RepID=UPI001F114A68|nr:YbaK/EbsC family protein [Shimazuella soli]MCH5583967.1 YbaK/EbsC family protein [Shimazuella soli]